MQANDRVQAGSTFYRVQGTAAGNITSVGTVTDTGETGCPALCNSTQLYVSTVSAEDAYCAQTTLRTVYHNEATWADATVVYGTSSDCSTPQAGNRWYSDGVNTWSWNGVAKTLISNPSCP